MLNKNIASSACPKVLVLLATFNGIHYIKNQLDSILLQKHVNLFISISDDYSNDGTYEFLLELSSKDYRIKLNPLDKTFCSAGKNFYRLILDADLHNFDYVSLADQDDIWQQDKLIRHIELMKKNNVHGVSSNVIAFWPDGKTKLIDKAQPQRELDFIFESAGPGCTFLMTPWLVNKVKQLLVDESNAANQINLHDWLLYAVCRASGKDWHIDQTPTLQYRQHDKNVVGANSGIKAKLARLKKISNGWYRAEVLKILAVTSQLSDGPKLIKISGLLEKKDFLSRLKLLQFIPQARRKRSDRIFLALMIIFGLF